MAPLNGWFSLCRHLCHLGHLIHPGGPAKPVFRLPMNKYIAIELTFALYNGSGTP